MLCFFRRREDPMEELMLRKLLTALCLAALAACAPTPPRPAPPASPSAPEGKPAAPASVRISGYEQKLIAATNAFRKENGLPALAPDVRLIQIAQAHAANMARQDRFGDSDKNGHVLDGKGIEHRIETGGYDFGRIAENVGYQLNRSDHVASMMEGWKASAGHRRNMLLSDVGEIGVGAAPGKSGRWYFVQLFGRPLDSPAVVKTSN
jgi:uncharacterized protein YkwD